MFWRILKKDLKRKKTMNIILLLFVILCSMFAAAAVNNIIAVTGGIEHYFDAADVPEITVQMLFSEENDLEEKMGELTFVKEIRTEHWLCVSSSKYFRHHGKELDNFTNAAYLLSDREMAINYFDENNHIIESVDKGCFYASTPFLQDIDIKEGDEVELDVGDSQLCSVVRHIGSLPAAKCRIPGSDAVLAPAKQQVFRWGVNSNRDDSFCIDSAEPVLTDQCDASIISLYLLWYRKVKR